MIPFLLQHRLLGGGGPPPGVVISPPDWSDDSYEAASYQLSGTATSNLTFSLNSDGSYVVSATNEFGVSVVASGYWHSSPAIGVGSGFEARYAVTGSSGGGVVANDASAFASLSGDLAFSLTASRSAFGVVNALRLVLAEIRIVGGSVAASGPFSAAASAEVG